MLEGRTAARLTEGWCGNPDHGRLQAVDTGPPYCPACGCRWELQDQYRAKLVTGDPGARVERPVYLLALDWAGPVLAECEVQHLATCAPQVYRVRSGLSGERPDTPTRTGVTAVTRNLTWKRHRAGTYADVLASDSTRGYLLTRSGSQRDWLIEVYPTKAVDGDQFRDHSGDPLDAMRADTLPLAQAVAQQYADLGDDYQQHEHGGRSRATEAVIRAYDADKAARA